MPKVVRFHQTGGPEVLKIEDLPLKDPGAGEVRLKVEAIGLNRAEIMFRVGHYLERPEFPSRDRKSTRLNSSHSSVSRMPSSA